MTSRALALRQPYSALTPLELANVCATGADPDAWDEFVRRFHPLISGFVARTARRWGAPSREVIDDLVQETFLKLCAKRCRSFLQFRALHGDAIFGYLKVVTSNLVNDYFRGQHAIKRGSGQSAADFEVAAVADSGAAEAIERMILWQQIERILLSAGGRDRLIFRLYYREGRSARDIAALPSICLTVKGVESAILRVTRLVRDRVRRDPTYNRDKPPHAYAFGLRR